ncbi:MAG TPA: DUF4412 domain-containing protein [Steroidobacteraceae bacterium]|jgi:hypothetical protein|nr:DUF4412 domain-containing protein [Steroidobacteraceae bacterium]
MKRIATIAVGLLAAHTASAGVYAELFDHNLTTNTSKLKQKMYVQGGNGRIVDADGRATIIKGGTLYIVDDSDKTYVVFDKATMEQLARNLNEGMAQMKEQLAKLPPEQRAQVEQQMGPAAAAILHGGEQQWIVDVKDTGKSDKVDGRACKLWDVTRNGELDEQICVVPYSAMPGTEDLQKVFATFARSFEEMAKSVPMLAGMMAGEFSAQVKANGVPVRRRVYENGKLGEEETLVKTWREEAVPASMFEIPAGYKVKPMGPGR